MILDKIENLHRYLNLHKGFGKAAEFLACKDLTTLSAGKHEIDGLNVYAMVSVGPGRKKDEAKLEAHKNYIDIQLILSGTDEMGWKPSGSCRFPSSDYDAESDIRFFSDEPDAWFPVKSGMFAIFFPDDAHLPLISSGLIHKIVIKIAANQEP